MKSKMSNCKSWLTDSRFPGYFFAILLLSTTSLYILYLSSICFKIDLNCSLIEPISWLSRGSAPLTRSKLVQFSRKFILFSLVSGLKKRLSSMISSSCLASETALKLFNFKGFFFRLQEEFGSRGVYSGLCVGERLFFKLFFGLSMD